MVDMQLGTCSCIAGQDGSPCSHLAAVVRHYHIPSVNCIPTLVPEVRQQLAAIAMGSKAIQDQQFYSGLHQKEEEMSEVTCSPLPHDQPDLSGPQGTQTFPRRYKATHTCRFANHSHSCRSSRCSSSFSF